MSYCVVIIALDMKQLKTNMFLNYNYVNQRKMGEVNFTLCIHRIRLLKAINHFDNEEYMSIEYDAQSFFL